MSFPMEPTMPQVMTLQPLPSFESGATINTPESELLVPAAPFTEAIVSWNLEHPQSAQISLEAKVVTPAGSSKWLSLGKWSQAADGDRHSEKDQQDEIAKVLTDVVRSKAPATGLYLRWSLHAKADTPLPRFKRVVVTFSDETPAPVETTKALSPLNSVVDIEHKTQSEYGEPGLCSPTSLAMVLSYWAKAKEKSQWNHDVPAVRNAVWDPVYKGAGNWTFNTSYAGSLEGLTSYVARFAAISELEQWIEIGVPVVCSVSFDLIRGKPLSPNEQGHLVVLVGFDLNGNPIFNDPAYKEKIRRTYLRSDFAKAWNYSKRTVYLVYPDGMTTPPTPSSRWLK
jgi:uncharacterized protein YvpB